MTPNSSKEALKGALQKCLAGMTNDEKVGKLLRFEAGARIDSIIPTEGRDVNNYPFVRAVSHLSCTDLERQQIVEELLEEIVKETLAREVTRPVDIVPPESFVRSLTMALDRLDYNRMRRFYHGFLELQAHFVGPYESMNLRSTRNGDQIPLEMALKLCQTYSDFGNDLHQSGVSQFLMENAGEIRRYLSTDGVPTIDAILLNQLREASEAPFPLGEMVTLATRTDFLTERNFGKQPLEIRLEIIVRHVNEANEEPTADANQTKGSKKTETIAALGKVALGGCLAAANVSYSILLGPVSSLIASHQAVGTATSIYTGLNSAWDGLKSLLGT